MEGFQPCEDAIVDVKRNRMVVAFEEVAARSIKLRVPRILGSKEAKERLKSSRHAL